MNAWLEAEQLPKEHREAVVAALARPHVHQFEMQKGGVRQLTKKGLHHHPGGSTHNSSDGAPLPVLYVYTLRAVFARIPLLRAAN